MGAAEIDLGKFDSISFTSRYGVDVTEVWTGGP
jgi:hypothetical protein